MFVNGQVLGHEAVQDQRVHSLVAHVATTELPPALVALLHDAGPVYRRTVEAAVATRPLLEFTGPGGRLQSVWRVPDGAATDDLVAELCAARHYIADGHHRVAAALVAWRAAGCPDGSSVLGVLHAMDGLRLSAFHRRITGPVDVQALLDLLQGEFDVEAADRARPGRRHVRDVRGRSLARRAHP